ncbi:TetR/AcrR family transcriptional regulator [Dictyobacter formicarum]|uniref:TetR family transcriptional regulator n=1 Tax=Dictyobacter formicarum TaxID=2778368 RepID=A0ABQ3VHR8_9CHLR|nr:TetR/AcrR family transcriptional regulator [Dictyobacter formicarum]GHO85712.1 TetR family transcriptional regulator [Dictyobacter formicarum]
MKQEKHDRRSQRTRSLVTTAMMALLSQKRYDQITVGDLLERANIGRSTFYSHYFDKEDVLADLVKQQSVLISQRFSRREAGQHLIPALEFFEHFQEHYPLLHALLREHAGEIVWETAQECLKQSLEQALPLVCPDPEALSIPLPMIAQYLSEAFLGLLKWWLSADMPSSPEEMERIFEQLALPGVQAAVGGSMKRLET